MNQEQEGMITISEEKLVRLLAACIREIVLSVGGGLDSQDVLKKRLRRIIQDVDAETPTIGNLAG